MRVIKVPPRHEWTVFSTDNPIPEDRKIVGEVDIYPSKLGQEQFIRVERLGDGCRSLTRLS